jgi:hypothetical protein
MKKKLFNLYCFSFIICTSLNAQKISDVPRSEEKFELFYNEYFVKINKHKNSIDVFGLAEGHHWQITGGPTKYKKNLLKDIANDINIENPVISDSALIVIDSTEKIKRYLHEQYFNQIRLLFSVEKVGGEYKFIVYQEGVKK